MDDARHLLRWSEIRALVRLAGELRELPPGSDAQRAHAITGLVALVGAKVGTVIHAGMAETGHMRLRCTFETGWADATERSIFLHYIDRAHEAPVDPTAMGSLRAARPGEVTTRIREDLVDARTWYRCDHFHEYRRPARLDSFIYSVFFDDAFEVISLHRPAGDRAFDERDRAIVDAFHQECTFLHAAAPPKLALGPRDLDLSPRLLDTLRGLARGLGEKEIAAELGISAHTVHDYVKVLYRRFGVRTRGELLARVLGAG